MSVLDEPVWWVFCGMEAPSFGGRSTQIIGPFADKAAAAHDVAFASTGGGVGGHCKNDHGMWFCSIVDDLIEKKHWPPLYISLHYNVFSDFDEAAAVRRYIDSKRTAAV